MSAQPAERAPLTIAVVKPCCIGDCVMALPAIESLSRAFPYAHIHAFTGRHSAPVFRATEHVQQVYYSPDQLTATRVPGMAWNLRTAGHDWIVVLDRSRWLIAAARAAGPGKLVTLPQHKQQIRHEIDVYLDALRAVGIETPISTPKLNLHDEARQAADTIIDEIGQDFVALQPGGAENPGTSMLDKRWPAERYQALAGTMATRGLRPVLTGGPADELLCRSIANAVPNANPLVLAGRFDLLTTAAVIERARFYVGADTGVSHIAAAVGTQSVVIFGPTNPLRYGPRGEHVTIIAPEESRHLPDVDLRKGAPARGRPSTSSISTDEVLSASEALLTRSGNGQP